LRKISLLLLDLNVSALQALLCIIKISWLLGPLSIVTFQGAMILASPDNSAFLQKQFVEPENRSTHIHSSVVQGNQALSQVVEILEFLKLKAIVSPVFAGAFPDSDTTDPIF
jgi:hypothetical protein